MMSATRTVPTAAYCQPREGGSARCTQCGAEFEPSGRFCPFDGTPLERPMSTAQPRWPVDGRYHFEALIGQGSSAVVYRVRHVHLNRAFALKVLHCHAHQQPVTQFMESVRAAAALSHPNLCEVTDFGRLSDGRCYLVMGLLAGKDLGWWMQRQVHVSPAAVMHVLCGVARGLAAAHAAGLVVRGLEPSKVVIAEPLDAGAVKVAATLHPVQDATAELAADIRAFGTLAEALLACTPSRDDVGALPMLPADERLTQGLRALTLRCKSTDAPHRYRDGSALWEALQALAAPVCEWPGRRAVSAPRTAAPAAAVTVGQAPASLAADEPYGIDVRRDQRSVRRRARLVGIGAAGLVLVGALIWQGHGRVSSSDTPARTPPASAAPALRHVTNEGAVSSDTPSPTAPASMAPAPRYATDLGEQSITTTGSPAVVPLDPLEHQEPHRALRRAAPREVAKPASASEPSGKGSSPTRGAARRPGRVKHVTKEKATVDAKGNTPQNRSSGAVDWGEGDIIDPWAQR